MNKDAFKDYAMNENNKDYEIATSRIVPLYHRHHDMRSEFGRDYTRIIFSLGYRRLKHKTQVFFAVDNDHVCTRSEHVSLVESVSYTISNYLGLNTELTKAIAVGHDIGHAPFGHGGEKILSDIATQHGLHKFWHEQNSLHFIDDIETLEDNNHIRHNLNLTYAIRDGIISHCGEMSQKNIMKREEAIDLNEYTIPGQFNPFTWEGCVVKISDKIAYLARDIEDALRLNVLKEGQVHLLKDQINQIVKEPFSAINNGTIVNYFISDVCHNSHLDVGISLSQEAYDVMNLIMKFNYQNIYLIDRVKVHSDYVKLIINSIFDFLMKYEEYAKERHNNILIELNKDVQIYPKMLKGFIHWLEKYSYIEGMNRDILYQNKVIYDFVNDDKAYLKAIIDYLSGMSDAYIIQIFNEQLSF